MISIVLFTLLNVLLWIGRILIVTIIYVVIFGAALKIAEKVIDIIGPRIFPQLT